MPQHPRNPLCDFCSPPAPALWWYPAESFRMMNMGTVHHSDSDWAACAQCHDLIEANNRAGLLDRAIGGWQDTVPTHELFLLRSSLRRFHDQFFAHRTGLPSRIDPVTDRTGSDGS